MIHYDVIHGLPNPSISNFIIALFLLPKVFSH